MVRSDARINRTRILDTARKALAEDGTISLNQIAQRAAVGPGTLYRNFPTREALILALYREEVDHIIHAAPELLASLPPLEALRRWTNDLVKAMRMKHGLGEALSPSAHQAMTDENYGPVIDAITHLLDAGKRDGTIRTDADPVDFLQFTGALWRASTSPSDRAQPMLAIILDGLRAQE